MGNDGRTHIRVLHVIPRLSPTGGAETSLAQMIGPLAEKGVSSIVVALRHHPDPSRLEELRAVGVDVRVLDHRVRMVQIARLVGIIRETRPDLVHTTLLEAGTTGRLAARLTRTPVVHSVVNTVYRGAALTSYGAPWKARVYQTAERLLTRFATTGVHALTHSSAGDAETALGIRRGRITVIPRGRDPSVLGICSPQRREAARTGLGLGPDVPILLNVARQEHQKGHVHLIRTLAMVRLEVPDVMLVIAGRPGAATQDIAATIDLEGVAQNVRILGPRDDIPELLCAADVFAFSSLWEGLGGAVLEAMAMRRPVVAFAVPAVCEVVGDTAVTVPIGDEDALSAALVGLLRDSHLAARLADRAGARFDRCFTIDGVAETTANWYRTVISTLRSA